MSNKVSTKPHPIIYLDYYPRIAGHFFICTCTILNLSTVNRNSFFTYLLLIIEAFIWPHLALLCSLRSKAPKVLELRFLLLDSLLTGAWCAYFGFQLFPTTAYILASAIGNFSINGFSLGLKGLAANTVGALVVVVFFGFLYHPTSNLGSIIYSMIALLTFSNVTGYLAYYRAKVAKNTRAQLREVMEEFDNINKILQKSSAVLELANIMNILEEFLKNKIITFDTIGLQILDPETKELKCQVIKNEQLSNKAKKQLLKISDNPSMVTIEKEVLISQEPKYILDINDHSLSDLNRNIQEHVNAQSIAVYPVIIKNKSIGIVTFYSATLLNPSVIQIKKISNYINYISLMINNTLLYTDLKNQRAELSKKNTQLNVVSTQLAKYIPPQLFAKIMQGEVSAHIIARKKFLTVFFSDLIGFTALSDLLPSNILTTILNIYLDTMTNVALKHGGTIDKYMGDMIMIFFGDSENSSPAEDAKRCALMAIEMREKLQESNLKWVEFGIDEPLKMRMGIHSGICSIGNFGSNFRMNYTIIGSTVNLASRLEHIAKANEILISEETYELLKESFTCSKQDAVQIKGIEGCITPYQIIGRCPSSSDFFR